MQKGITVSSKSLKFKVTIYVFFLEQKLQAVIPKGTQCEFCGLIYVTKTHKKSSALLARRTSKPQNEIGKLIISL